VFEDLQGVARFFSTFLVKIFGDYRNKSYLCTIQLEFILIDMFGIDSLYYAGVNYLF